MNTAVSPLSRDARFLQLAAEVGLGADGHTQVGGDYAPSVRHGGQVFVSGQVPRVGSVVVATGRVGTDATLEQAQVAARICALRALAQLRQNLGSLDRVAQLLRVTVYTQCTADFTQQSEVADAASALLRAVLGEAGRHTRTSVGVYQLPKNAMVELDLIAADDGTV